MQKIGNAMHGGISFSEEDRMRGVGPAEECQECGRVYCAGCYPSRPLHTCVCGRGSESREWYNGAFYRGPIRLIMVKYM